MVLQVGPVAKNIMLGGNRQLVGCVGFVTLAFSLVGNVADDRSLCGSGVFRALPWRTVRVSAGDTLLAKAELLFLSWVLVRMNEPLGKAAVESVFMTLRRFLDAGMRCPWGHVDTLSIPQ